MAEPTHRKLKIFISYSHEDAPWKDVLLRHLRVLERTNVVEFWDVSDIEPGTDWSTEIVQAVRSIDMAVLLLSPSFLASDFIADRELPLILERRKKELLVVLPILVRPTSWTQVKGLAELQFLNDPSKPLSELSHSDQEHVVASIAFRIAELAEAIRLSEESHPRSVDKSAEEPRVEPDFFISHSTIDGDFAELLKLRIASLGYTAWVDSDRLSPGTDWRQEIDQAIKQSAALVAIMSVEARSSEYVTYEWAFAWGAGIRIVPVMLRETPLHPRLATLQYLDFTNRIARPWDRLFAALAEAKVEK